MADGRWWWEERLEKRLFGSTGSISWSAFAICTFRFTAFRIPHLATQCPRLLPITKIINQRRFLVLTTVRPLIDHSFADLSARVTMTLSVESVLYQSTRYCSLPKVPMEGGCTVTVWWRIYRIYSRRNSKVLLVRVSVSARKFWIRLKYWLWILGSLVEHFQMIKRGCLLRRLLIVTVS